MGEVPVRGSHSGVSGVMEPIVFGLQGENVEDGREKRKECEERMRKGRYVRVPWLHCSHEGGECDMIRFADDRGL